jgi:hypothetical protein
LSKHYERAAFPVTHEVAATAIRATNDPSNTPNAGIAAGLLEFLVIRAEIVDIDQHEPNGVRVALRELPVPLQQLFEVRA